MNGVLLVQDFPYREYERGVWDFLHTEYITLQRVFFDFIICLSTKAKQTLGSVITNSIGFINIILLKRLGYIEIRYRLSAVCF